MLRKTNQWKKALQLINFWDIDSLPCHIIRDDELNTKGNRTKC